MTSLAYIDLTIAMVSLVFRDPIKFFLSGTLVDPVGWPRPKRQQARSTVGDGGGRWINANPAEVNWHWPRLCLWVLERFPTDMDFNFRWGVAKFGIGSAQRLL